MYREPAPEMVISSLQEENAKLRRNFRRLLKMAAFWASGAFVTGWGFGMVVPGSLASMVIWLCYGLVVVWFIWSWFTVTRVLLEKQVTLYTDTNPPKRPKRTAPSPRYVAPPRKMPPPQPQPPKQARLEDHFAHHSLKEATEYWKDRGAWVAD